MKFVQQTPLLLFMTLCGSVDAIPFDAHDMDERDYFLIQKIKEKEKHPGKEKSIARTFYPIEYPAKQERSKCRA